MKKAVFLLLGGLFIFVSCLVFFWTVAFIGVSNAYHNKKQAHRRYE